MLHGVRKGMSMDGITYITRGCGLFRNAGARSSSEGKWTKNTPSMWWVFEGYSGGIPRVFGDIPEPFKVFGLFAM